jgi:hypothetical protein
LTTRRARWLVGSGAIVGSIITVRILAGADAFYAYSFAVAFLLGIRSTVRLAQTYVNVRHRLPRLRRLALQAFVVVSGSITFAAGWFGFLTVRRILGFEPIDGSQFAGFIIAELVLLIPLYLDTIVDVIAYAERDDADDRDPRDTHGHEAT